MATKLIIVKIRSNIFEGVTRIAGFGQNLKRKGNVRHCGGEKTFFVLTRGGL